MHNIRKYSYILSIIRVRFRIRQREGNEELKMKAKRIAILLSAVMLLGMGAACSKKDETQTSAKETTTYKTRPVVESTTTEPTTSADFRNTFDMISGDFIDLCRKYKYDLALQEYHYDYIDGIDEDVRALSATGEGGSLEYRCIVFKEAASAMLYFNDAYDTMAASPITKEEKGKTPTGNTYVGVWQDTDDVDQMSLLYVMGDTFIQLTAHDDNPEHHRTVEKQFEELTGTKLKVSTI